MAGSVSGGLIAISKACPRSAAGNCMALSTAKRLCVPFQVFEDQVGLLAQQPLKAGVSPGGWGDRAKTDYRPARQSEGGPLNIRLDDASCAECPPEGSTVEKKESLPN